jgi:hypothetical protein
VLCPIRRYHAVGAVRRCSELPGSVSAKKP